MADQIRPRRDSFGMFRNGLHRGAGALTGRKKSPPPVMAAPAAEGPGATPGKEARDTVAGCRDRAADDRLHAVGADTENGRRVFERSAASWEARADEIQEGDRASAQQRAADRDLWAREE
jgi:hypothetical protein